MLKEEAGHFKLVFMKMILFAIVILCANIAFSQYQDVYREIGTRSIFRILPASLSVQASDTLDKGDPSQRVVAYSYKLAAGNWIVHYTYPKESQYSDSSCGHFSINNQEFFLAGNFQDNFACDYDINSAKLYTGSFNGRKYLLLTGINSGSGEMTTNILCLLFDITNPKAIKFYPLWSKYGSQNCFQDFNKDGNLDFISVRHLKNSSDTYELKVQLMTLTKQGFVIIDEQNKYIIGKYSVD